MKSTILVATLAAAIAVVTMPALAQQNKAADKTAQAKPKVTTPSEFDKQLPQMQENMNKMQEQMEKIRQTQDPQERQRLLQEHWSTMQSAMALMHGMGGPGMMGGPGVGRPGMGGGMMGWGHMGGYYSGLTPEQVKQREYMIDQKLRMHQFMMEQMMQQQYWMAKPPGGPAK